MMACPLCYEDMDSHEHLLFECKFSNCLWNMVKMKIKFQSADIKLKDLISKLSCLQNGNSIGSIVRRLCLAACVYLIWQERNNRIFRNEERSIDSLFTTLCNSIKWRLSSLKVKRSQAVINIAVAWDIKCDGFDALGNGSQCEQGVLPPHL
ncbi:hypothetical protein Tco_0588508 [Tanacetum coccineum]